jgi:light-regulated signal transduction histidine kinase (bacteriophytochrome)
VGIDVQETARSVSFCAHAILQPEVFVVPDTLSDPRFRDNPLVTGPPKIRFYAAAPLLTADGLGLGTLCVVDQRPRTLSPVQDKALRVLRRHVLTLMEVRRQNHELRALNTELEAFGYAVSHDLVAPLRRISGFSEALRESHAGALGAEGRELLQRIQRSVSDMRQLVNGLLTLSRVTRAELRMTKVDLSAMAVELLDELHQGDPRRGVERHVEPGLSVYGDPALLRTALANLLGNAWKFTSKRERSRIELGAQQANGRRVFYVRDNGAGFDMAHADKLLVPFRRLHTQQEFEGIGIGLATVNRIVQRHGGQIWAEGRVDGGATFYFAFDGRADRQSAPAV